MHALKNELLVDDALVLARRLEGHPEGVLPVGEEPLLHVEGNDGGIEPGLLGVWLIEEKAGSAYVDDHLHSSFDVVAGYSRSRKFFASTAGPLPCPVSAEERNTLVAELYL